jgi:hypothetical protein
MIDCCLMPSEQFLSIGHLALNNNQSFPYSINCSLGIKQQSFTHSINWSLGIKQQSIIHLHYQLVE